MLLFKGKSYIIFKKKTIPNLLPNELHIDHTEPQVTVSNSINNVMYSDHEKIAMEK